MNSSEQSPGSAQDVQAPAEQQRGISRRDFIRDAINVSLSSFLVALNGWYDNSAHNLETGSGRTPEPSVYVPLDPIPVLGTNIRVIGVAHSRSTLVKNIEDIRSRIQHSPFIFLEVFFDEIRDRARPGIGIDQIMHDRFDNYTSVKFFAGVGRICAEEGKDIIVVNPQNKQLEIIDKVIRFGLPGVVLGSSTASLVDVLRRRPMTRRRFLEYSVLCAASLVTASYWDFPRKLRNALDRRGLLTTEVPENEQADILSWSMLDYRDIRSSEGIETAIKLFRTEYFSQDEIAMFEGAGHNGKLEYLRDPKLREAKRLVYPHYNLVDTDTVRRYSFDPVANTWFLRQEIPY